MLSLIASTTNLYLVISEKFKKGGYYESFTLWKLLDGG